MSQTLAAELGLRELILGGALAPGERLSELALVERLGVSRTPVRAALSKLAEEGLVAAIASGGYAVRAFDEAEIRDAIDLRGTLEGMAARMAAERGPDPAAFADMCEAVEAIDTLLADGLLAAADFSDYVAHNQRFHNALTNAAGSALVAREVARAAALPFASPSGFVRAHATLPQTRASLSVAQDQHRALLDAITAREGARAEALMREHARLTARNLQIVLRSGRTLVHGAALIRATVED